MPWKSIDVTSARRAFVAARWNREDTMSGLCRRFGISRQCGYEWWRRAQAEGTQCRARAPRTKAAERLQARWQARVLKLRQRYRFAGAAQLHWYLRRAYPLGPWPAVRTIGRWLAVAGLTRRVRRKAPAGPVLKAPPPRMVRVANDAWSADLKGSFLTGEGRRVCALTVRDVASRYVLLVQHVERADERQVGALLRRLFRRHGPPRALWVDNGPPFGGMGPRGWSKLAAKCVRLGIHVEYGRPGCPQDNAEHEQMHQVLAAQTVNPAAHTLAAQQRRFERWRQRYNEDRPNRALGMQLPCALYQPRGCKEPARDWAYPRAWEQKRTDPRGRIHWAGKARMIGRAFAGELVALQPQHDGIVLVYFGPHLLGELRASDPGYIRAVQIPARPRQRHLVLKGGEAAASPSTPPLNPRKGGSFAPSLKPSPK